MYSNNNQCYKPKTSISNNNRWGQQPQQHQVATNVNNTDLSNILSLVGGVHAQQQQQVHQQPSEIANLKQTSNPNYVHPDAQHADAVLRAKAIAAQLKAKQIAAGFSNGVGDVYPPPVVHQGMKTSTSYSSLMADNNTPVINTDVSNTAAMNTAKSWSLPDSLPPTLNTLDVRYKAPPSSQSLIPPPTQAIAAANNNFNYMPANTTTHTQQQQQQRHIDELRMLNMDGSKQPILPPTSQTLGKFHPLKEEDNSDASLFSDTDNDEHKRRDEHIKELQKLNMDGSPNSTKAILKKLPPQQDEEVESDDESLFGSSSDDEDEVFGQESSHVQHAKVMAKVQAQDFTSLPLTGTSGDKPPATLEAPCRRGKDVASLQRRGVTQPSSEAKKQKIPIFNPPTLKGGEADEEDASSDDGSGSSKKSGGLLGGLLSKVGSKDKAQNKLYRENTKKIKYRDTTVKDLTPDRSSEKEKKLQKFLMKQQGADAMSGKTNVELYSTPSSSTTNAIPNTDTASTTKKKKSTTNNNNDWQYSSQETKWNKNYNIIQQYISTHGNTDIPEGHSLHKWVQSQRNICLRWIAGVNKNEELIGSHLQRYVHVYKLHSINFDWGNVDRRVLHDVLSLVDMNLSPAQRETLFPKKKMMKKLPKQNLARIKERKGSVKSGSVFDSISSKRKQERDDTLHQGKKLARNVTDHNSSDEGGGSDVKKRPPRDEDIIDFTDVIDSGSISWNDHTKKPKKRRKAALNNMPANQWVNLLMKFKERHTPNKVPLPSCSSKTSSNKCWSDLVKAGDDKEESINLSALVRSKIVEEQLQNSIKEAAAKASSDEMMTVSELKKAREVSEEATKASSPEKSNTSASKEPLRVLKNGKKVHAAWWKTSARSGPPAFYPGVVESSKVVVKGGESKVLYNIDYDDGDKGKDIDGNLVKTRKTYLRKNLKPFLMAGDEVYAAWWEDEKRDKAATWHPGVIKSVVELSYGGEYGPIRKYDVAFDDGDELDSIEDYFVMDKKDYLISVCKEDKEWMGVENRLEKSSIDNWEKYAGLWVSTIDGEEQLFGQLSDALRAYDKYTVRRKGVKTKEKNLNLPEEWAFPKPFGICPPVHIGGSDDDSSKYYSSPEVSSKKNKRKRGDSEVIDMVEPSTAEIKLTPLSSADAETKECGDCNKVKPKRKFSEKEWTKEDDGDRQCEKCIKLDKLLAKHREQNVLPTIAEQVATTKAQAEEVDSHLVLGHSRSSTKDVKSTSSAKPAQPMTKKESKTPALPASEFGEGWKVRGVPRSNGTHIDRYYYSPIMGYKFRSKAEVGRFLDHLEEANGDESTAIDIFKGSKKKGPSKKRQASSSQQSNVPPKKARRPSVTIAYIEPSQSSGSSEDSVGKGKTQKKETKSSSKETQYIKPTIKKGEKIYAVWSGPDGKGEVWYPGRTWDSTEEPSNEGYGPIRKYDIVFDDGDMEPDVDEIWVSKKSEYEVSIAKPEDTWIGVINVRFEYSNDEYARLIGWYKTTVGDVNRVYTSLRSALRAYDKFIIESKGKDKVSAKELNFPEEHF